MNHLKYKFLNFLDDKPLLSLIVRSNYGRVIKAYIKSHTKLQNIKYDAPIDPFKLYWISPDKIVKEVSTHFWFQPITKVVDGTWDTNTCDFTDHYFYRSFINRFEHNVAWENTELYKRKVYQLKNGQISNYRYGETEEDILHRLRKVDEIYNMIDELGYLTQRELRQKSLGAERTHLPPELFEIAVNIGRDGDWLFDDGRHRLIIAKILDIDTVPVRVLVRHRKWQHKRDEAYSEGSSRNLQHPDILTPK